MGFEVFGVECEGGAIKAFSPGILNSYRKLEYMGQVTACGRAGWWWWWGGGEVQQLKGTNLAGADRG